MIKNSGEEKDKLYYCMKKIEQRLKFWKRIFPKESSVSMLVITTIDIALCHSEDKHY